MTSGPQKFAVDIRGLLDALTDQFPEPLLCVRELVQNAADAGAGRIEVDVAFDANRQLFRLSVHDDGRGMNESEVEAYLTIGHSDKDPNRDRGRFGIGKLSPYALGISRMIVQTSDGHIARKLTFRADGSGTISETELRPRGTVVRVYKSCDRDTAEQLAKRTADLVEDQCASLPIPLFVNGERVNRDVGLPTRYSIRFSTDAGSGQLGIIADPIRLLMGGGIVLESGASILGSAISFALDSPRLSPTLSRNAVRRDNAFDALLREAQNEICQLTEKVASELRTVVDQFKKQGQSMERALALNDRAALEWLRSRLLDPETQTPDPVIRRAPVLETADGGLVSAEDLLDVIRREGRLPFSRVPRTKEEICGYIDRGVPVLLLYCDLEDFLDRQRIQCVEVDGQDDGIEVLESLWSSGEHSLARRAKNKKIAVLGLRNLRFAGALAITVSLSLSLFWAFGPSGQSKRSSAQSASTHTPSSFEQGGHLRRESKSSDETFDVQMEKKGLTELEAGILAAPSSDTNHRPRGFMFTLAGLIAILSAAAGFAVLHVSFALRPQSPASWIQEELDVPMTIGDNIRRRFDVFRRAFFHPIDFLIARSWSIRAAGHHSLSASSVLENYRQLNSEPVIRSGVRLDLDSIEIGFIDLVSSVGEPHDGRILLTRGAKALLNRNHPTVKDLIAIAEVDKRRAHILLDILLATDPRLAKGTDPRQVEWDLLSRAEQSVLQGETS